MKLKYWFFLIVTPLCMLEAFQLKAIHGVYTVIAYIPMKLFIPIEWIFHGITALFVALVMSFELEIILIPTGLVLLISFLIKLGFPILFWFGIGHAIEVYQQKKKSS